MKQIFTIKGLITIVFIIFITIAIYYVFNSNQKSYTALGDFFSTGINKDNKYKYGYKDYTRDYLNDSKKLNYYNDTYTYDDYSIEQMLKDIENNDIIINNGITINIKKLLRESDIITLTIGMNDLLNYLNINNIEELELIDKKIINEVLIIIKQDLIKLIKEIKKYAKKEIILVGYTLNTEKNNNIDYVTKYINNLYETISEKENLKTVILENRYNNYNSIYPNYKIYKKISKLIIKTIK